MLTFHLRRIITFTLAFGLCLSFYVLLSPTATLPNVVSRPLREYQGALRDQDRQHVPVQPLPVDVVEDASSRPHPINDLIRDASKKFDALLSKEPASLADAAAEYRRQRGRHPPPEFDAWYHFAKRQSALVTESMFDQIYRDIEPFWGVKAADIRWGSGSWHEKLSIRHGRLTTRREKRYRLDVWHKMLKEIESYLPDVDLAFNTMDETRVIIPWERINDAISMAHGSRRSPSADKAVTTYPIMDKDETPIPNHHFSGEYHMWEVTRKACAPLSGGRESKPEYNYTGPPIFPSTYPNGSYHGYVANWTIAKDPCQHPHLREMYGSFVEPMSTSVSTDLFPIFSAAKLSVASDILVPATRYWETSNELPEPSERSSWKSKHNKAMWRDSATGGRNKEGTWRRFHRHRFVALANGTQMALADYLPDSDGWAHNFPVLNDNKRTYEVTAQAYTPDRLQDWAMSVSDVLFTDLVCFPGEGRQGCSYTDEYFTTSVAWTLSPRDQTAAKYAPDVDGNSYSDRYHSLLRSHSVPIKGSLYSEWHDSRLIPWAHFVPMDSTYVDYWGILDYFIGYDGKGQDAKGQMIGEAGSRWADRVLRREDMLVYLYRVVLEYARVAADERHRMGFVGDLGTGHDSSSGGSSSYGST